MVSPTTTRRRGWASEPPIRRGARAARRGTGCRRRGRRVIARALRVPITYDEATAFYRYVDAEPTALADFATATNHLLNSALTRASVAVFGSAPWALRLPSVLAGVAFLAVATALARRAVHPVIGAAGAVLLATNPYLLDYFALSRGYGLAIGLLSASWLVWLRWWTSPTAAAARTWRPPSDCRPRR